MERLYNATRPSASNEYMTAVTKDTRLTQEGKKEDLQAWLVKPGGRKHTTTSVVKPCNMCGKNLQAKDTDHARGQGCPYARHPNANTAGCAWAAISTGKALDRLHWNKIPAAKKPQGDDLVPLLDSELAMIYCQQPALLKVIQDKRAAIYS